jgi:rSAM/selenodomain-associated transferase 1
LSGPALIVIAKAPVAGRSKTRLCPPCAPGQAAALAEAALADTLAAVAETRVERLAIALEGEPGAWLPEGFEVHAQAGGGLDARLAAAFEAVGGPALLVGMDTPQLTAALLEDSLKALVGGSASAVLGAAPDGGYWAIGFDRPRPGALEGVPMSTTWTARAQRRRLRELGLEWAELPELRDVDTFEDAEEVALECPGSRFAAELDSVREALAAAPAAAAGRAR